MLNCHYNLTNSADLTHNSW